GGRGHGGGARGARSAGGGLPLGAADPGGASGPAAVAAPGARGAVRQEGRAMPVRVIEGVEALRSLVGQEVGVSDWFAVGQALIDAFAEATRDRQWIHLDAERTRAE